MSTSATENTKEILSKEQFSKFINDGNYSPKVVSKNYEKKEFKILFKNNQFRLKNTSSRAVRDAYKYIQKKIDTSKLQQTGSFDSNYISDDIKRIITQIETDGKTVSDSIGNDRLVSIYNSTDLDRFEDCIRSDGQIRKTLKKQSHFIVNNPKVGLDLDEEYDNDRQRSDKMKLILRFKPYIRARKVANIIFKNLKMKRKFRASIINSKTYGRGALEIIHDKDGLPSRVNILNSKQIGDIKINPDSWDFLGIYYYDQFTENNEKFIPYNHLFYLANDDFHLSEGSLYHGLSDIETCIDASETKRILVQKNIKEIAEALYAGFGWVKFKNPDVTTEQMQSVMDSIESGAWTGTDLDIEIIVEKIASDSPMLLEIVDQMNLEILRCLDMPSPLGGYENKQNYSNLQQTSEIWKEGTLISEKNWFIDAVEEQILNIIMKIILKQMGFEYRTGEPIILNGEQQTKYLLEEQTDKKEDKEEQPKLNPFQNNNNTFSNTISGNTQYTGNIFSPNEESSFQLGSESNNPFMPNNSMLTPELEIPPAKLTLVIEEPNFTPYKEKVESATVILEHGGMSLRTYDNFLGFPEEVEESEIREQEKKNEHKNTQNIQNKFELHSANDMNKPKDPNDPLNPNPDPTNNQPPPN